MSKDFWFGRQTAVVVDSIIFLTKIRSWLVSSKASLKLYLSMAQIISIFFLRFNPNTLATENLEIQQSNIGTCWVWKENAPISVLVTFLQK